MDIVFRSRKLENQCNDDTEARRTWGAEEARRLRRRLDDLAAAENLGVMRTLPGRPHELKGDRSGQISIDLWHPYRLIVEPADDPSPRKPDGGLDWDLVTTVRILGIENTHD